MQARAFFENVRQAERQLWLIRQQQEHAIEMATRLSGAGEEIKSPNPQSTVETAAICLADLSKDLEERAAEYQKIVKAAQKIIDQIQQERFRQVLTLRYLCNHSWRTISDEMDYGGEKSVYKVHGWALREANKILRDTK